MNLIILGAPGSGKGTQGKVLAERLGLYYFEAGDFARHLSKSNEKIKKIVESGQLIPEREMSGYVNEFLKNNVPEGKDILFDGYPRSEEQYLNLKKWLGQKQKKIDKAIFLEVNDNVVITRLSTRRVCESCGESFNLVTDPSAKPNVCDKCGGKLIQRFDDNTDDIKRRILEYKLKTKPMIDLLVSDGILVKVNGEKSIDEITQEIMGKLDQDYADN